MKTSHEVQVEIRENILPMVRVLSERILALYRESVGSLGPQGLSGQESDISTAYQLLDGSKNVLKGIANEFELPVPSR